MYLMFCYIFIVFVSYVYYYDSNNVVCYYDVYSLFDYHQDHDALKVAAALLTPWKWN